MKLIRLSTSGKLAEFNNDLYESLEIKPYSKIALLNASISLSFDNIIVDEKNNLFSFRITAGGNKRTVTLTLGTFSGNDFKTMLENAMNIAIDIGNTKNNGFQWIITSTLDSNWYNVFVIH